MIGTIIGGIGAYYANRKAGKVSESAANQYNMALQQIMAKQQGNVDTLLAPELYKDHMQSSDIQSTLGMVRQQMQQQQDAVTGGVTSRGGTTEATIAATGQANRQYADIINRLYSHADTYRRDARDRYMQGLQGLLSMEGEHAGILYGQQQGIADNWRQWGNNAITAGMGMDQAAEQRKQVIFSALMGNKNK